MATRTTGWRPAVLAATALATAVLSAGTAVANPPVFGSDGAGDSYYPTDGNGGYDVADYNVAISYDPVSHRLEGDTTITAKATQHLRGFNLDLYRLDVRSVEVNGRPAEFSRSGDHELVVRPRGVLPTGKRFTVRVRYDGVPEVIKDGALGDGGWQISASGGAFAAGQPHGATSWYPANDTPRDKATFHLSARVPDGWSVVSNGVERGTQSSGGWTTYRWAEETPTVPYLTTVAIDKWTIVRSRLADGTPVVDAYAPGAEGKKAAESRLPEVLDFLSSKFGPYPFRAAGGIFLADPIGFSLETQSRPVYAQWTDLATVVHENAHQWFGDSVSLDRWRDICLNECFASYATWLWSEAKEGVNLDQLYRDTVAKYRDKPEWWGRALYDMGRGNEFTAVYSKGKLALHALRRQIGDWAFDAVLKGWTNQHRYGNATWPEFERYVERISGQRLDGFFQAWFRGTSIPTDQYLWPRTLRP
ncbi:M1 family metallopeptidase [Streptoalloteichus hindustanus]|uniref:Aminopeptidase N n=1 Tax=Streptoalloteichus hindustanus TaxID=2017 RepID=A0A1M4W2A6_STRHI|nr:M1 family metallopeptidase [Streptoalloteichus hindustanus]SHE75092.1 Peptidase family M1 [Streptoalloteichus hindustanus]